MPELMPDLNKRRKVTLVHNYGPERNDEIRDRFQVLYDRIAERVTIERSHSLASGVMSDIELGDDEELLLGGGTNRKFGSEPELKDEVFARIRRLGAPAVGVCFGYQALGRAYGAGITKLSEARNGLAPITPEGSLKETLGNEQFDARVIQSWTLTEMPSGLSVVARSGDGNPQAFVHDTMPVGGTQYHPEINPDAQPGAVESFGQIRETILSRDNSENSERH